MNVVPDLAAPAALIDSEWYKDAIIYQLHIKSFADSNDDGIGDFNGLTSKLDYLQDLGVTALWLQPFYPSPGRDDGYDISDYRSLNPDFGTMKDFRRFMAEAKRRGFKVITELVINHTSDQHRWFQRARKAPPRSAARNWYVWSDTDQRYLGTRIIFTDTEKSNWAWDADAGAYYWHRFFSHQPDLNYANPQVFTAIVQVMKHWLDLGVDGFRLDAIPYLCEREGTNNENLPETHQIIKRLRAELDAYAPGTMLLAEANQWPEDVSAYFGDGDECHMAYHFPVMPRIYMAIAQEDRFPIADILRQTPDIPANCQWALFLRNHDELTLEMVTDVERDYLWLTYASDQRARLNLGIRRRLAPLMDNDRRKIELMNSLLLSLPGTPIIYYGDEIGMGDNIYLGDRHGVRTPMQWTPDRNGGFSRCDPAKLFLPPIMDAVYGYQTVNVEAQSRSLSSLLSWTKRMIAVRKASQVFGRGTLAFVRPTNRAVLGYVREYNGEVILCVANLSRSAQAAELDLSAWKGRVPIEMLGRTRFRRVDDNPYVITLAPYGFFWLMLCEDTAAAGPETVGPMPELTTLVFADGWSSLATGRSKQIFEREVLPGFLASRRWFAQKGQDQVKAKVDSVIPWTPDKLNGALALVDVTAGTTTTRYALPLGVQWRRFDRNSDQDKATLVAPLRRANREGMLYDAAADKDVVSWVVTQIHANETVAADGGQIEFRASPRFAEQPLPEFSSVEAMRTEQSNSTIIIDHTAVLKFYRRVSRGPNPEIEMGRFLTDEAGFTHSPALLGSVELVDKNGHSSLAVLHEFVGNQGDAWSFTTAYLNRTLEEARLLTAEPADDPERHAAFLNRMNVLGRRLGEMHLALASRSDIPAFAPEPITRTDLKSWSARAAESAARMIDRLKQDRRRLEGAALELADALIDRREPVLKQIARLLPAKVDADKIRHHGDFHLGQTLIVKDDAYIIDFEGEPQRGESERQVKSAAARDAAGLIRSLDYAVTAARLAILGTTPEEDARIAQAVDQWRLQSAKAFMGGIFEVTAGSRLWPQDIDVTQRLVRFFVAEKAIYEVEYELANRPDWVAVPLAGISRAIFWDAKATP
ncbi:MAG TPA: maltose alpha-D-glucosyltransferase [Xanthobacteraceae bacterium]|nr:maltose alpha-D-glucosyltransferase [Xanthobacteraceae bacterium]